MTNLIPSSGKFHASAKLLVLMLSHLLSPFLYDTRHSYSFTSSPRKVVATNWLILTEGAMLRPQDG